MLSDFVTYPPTIILSSPSTAIPRASSFFDFFLILSHTSFPFEFNFKVQKSSSLFPVTTMFPFDKIATSEAVAFFP